MPGSLTLVCSEPGDFASALRGYGIERFLVTAGSTFRARLTQVHLDHIRLTYAEEVQPRIAFMVVPNDALLIVLPVADKQSLVWGGIEMAAGEILTYGPGDKLHTWSSGRCRWRMIVSSADDLATYARAVRGDQFISAPARWRPRRATLRPLLQLHRTAIRAAETHSGALADLGASHGLEQQVIHALIECLASGAVAAETPVEHRDRELVAQFEELLSTRPVSDLSDCCDTLGVSQQLLRSCCYKHLGMDGARYERLRRDGNLVF